MVDSSQLRYWCLRPWHARCVSAPQRSCHSTLECSRNACSGPGPFAAWPMWNLPEISFIYLNPKIKPPQNKEGGGRARSCHQQGKNHPAAQLQTQASSFMLSATENGPALKYPPLCSRTVNNCCLLTLLTKLPHSRVAKPLMQGGSRCGIRPSWPACRKQLTSWVFLKCLDWSLTDTRF